MSKAVHEYHLIDLVGISHGGFVSLAGARQFVDIFHGNVRIDITTLMTGRGQR
jgi:hypothetical protein